MSAPTLIRRELANARLYFIPSGETVDSVTVSSTTWPDNNPTTNYTNYEVPDVEKVVEEIRTQETTRLVGRVSGGYQEESETHLRGKRWTATTAKTHTLLKQLQHGFSSQPATNTAQSPAVKAALYLDGVFLIELRDNTGTIIERTQVWARMTLQNPGEIGPDNRVLQVRFEMLYSANNTAVVI